jgi:mRNA-degrading endonuclease toxin of MazEF toxin-antitoxin module
MLPSGERGHSQVLALCHNLSRAPRRGDVYCVLDTVVGSEIRKAPAAVVVSNDSCNRSSMRGAVLPITSNVESLYPVKRL